MSILFILFLSVRESFSGRFRKTLPAPCYRQYYSRVEHATNWCPHRGSFFHWKTPFLYHLLFPDSHYHWMMQLIMSTCRTQVLLLEIHIAEPSTVTPSSIRLQNITMNGLQCSFASGTGRTASAATMHFRKDPSRHAVVRDRSSALARLGLFGNFYGPIIGNATCLSHYCAGTQRE